MKFSTGHVIDLVSNDVQRLEVELVKWFLFGTLAFLDIPVATFLLVYFIGWQALMGVIFLCFLPPYFAGLSHAGATLRLRTAAVSDRRISLMNQVISGIRTIKTHAWEDKYREKIKSTRRYEEKQCQYNVNVEKVDSPSTIRPQLSLVIRLYKCSSGSINLTWFIGG